MGEYHQLPNAFAKKQSFYYQFIISYSYANMSEYIIFHHGVHLVGCDVDRNLIIYFNLRKCPLQVENPSGRTSGGTLCHT